MNTCNDLNKDMISITFAVQEGKLYKHYSGKIYKVLSIARCSENPENFFVIYQGIYTCPTFGENQVWCRPYTMFIEKIVFDGKEQPRFAEIKS